MSDAVNRVADRRRRLLRHVGRDSAPQDRRGRRSRRDRSGLALLRRGHHRRRPRVARIPHDRRPRPDDEARRRSPTAATSSPSQGHLVAQLPTPRCAGPDVPGSGGIMRPVLAKILADATRASRHERSSRLHVHRASRRTDDQVEVALQRRQPRYLRPGHWRGRAQFRDPQGLVSRCAEATLHGPGCLAGRRAARRRRAGRHGPRQAHQGRASIRSRTARCTCSSPRIGPTNTRVPDEELLPQLRASAARSSRSR